MCGSSFFMQKFGIQFNSQAVNSAKEKKYTNQTFQHFYASIIHRDNFLLSPEKMSCNEAESTWGTFIQHRKINLFCKATRLSALWKNHFILSTASKACEVLRAEYKHRQVVEKYFFHISIFTNVDKEKMCIFPFARQRLYFHNTLFRHPKYEFSTYSFIHNRLIFYSLCKLLYHITEQYTFQTCGFPHKFEADFLYCGKFSQFSTPLNSCLSQKRKSVICVFFRFFVQKSINQIFMSNMF